MNKNYSKQHKVKEQITQLHNRFNQFQLSKDLLNKIVLYQVHLHQHISKEHLLEMPFQLMILKEIFMMHMHTVQANKIHKTFKIVLMF